MSEQVISDFQGPAFIQGAVSLEKLPDGIRPWRLIEQKRDLFEKALHGPAISPAGVRITLISDTSQIILDVSCPENCGTYDLLVDGDFHSRVEFDAGEPRRRLRFDNLPRGEHRLEIMLSHRRETIVHAIAIDSGASAKPFHDTRRRWSVYGSSITHCGSAPGPVETWPALVANRADLNLTCFGYGGNCHMEPIVARMIRDHPADVISMCLGINTHHGTLSERTFRAAVIGLIQIIREKHPQTPMVVVSPIYCRPRETGPGKTGMTLQLMREWILDAVTRLKAHGDQHLHYVSGLDILGPDEADWLEADELHPHAQGNHHIADRYAEIVMPLLGKNISAH